MELTSSPISSSQARLAIVTGGYSGIGLEAVRALAGKGVSVVVPVRSPDKAAESLAGVEGDVRMAPLDLADLASVRSFGQSIRPENVPDEGDGQSPSDRPCPGRHRRAFASINGRITDANRRQ